MAETKERDATCWCGDLAVTMRGEPVLVSSCCCTRCQRRTGSFFGVTVYFHPDQMVARRGTPSNFQRPDGVTTFNFCPRCGSNLWWSSPEWEDVIGVAGGCFADETLPSPVRMTNTEHKHPFVRPPPGVPTYEEGPPED
jgi:hypothetical protein